MMLSQDIVFTQLLEQEKMPFDFYLKSFENLKVDRPMFPSETCETSHRLVVIHPDQLLEKIRNYRLYPRVLFVCTAPCPEIKQRIEGMHETSFNLSVLAPREKLGTAVLFNSLQLIFDRFESWVSTLNRVSYTDGNFQDLVDSTVAVSFDPLCVIDKDFRHIAYCENSVKLGLAEKYVSEDNRITHEAYDEIITDSQFSTFYQYDHPFTSSVAHAECVCQNIFYRNEFVGRILINYPFNDQLKVKYYTDILEILAPFADAMFAKFKSFGQNDGSFNTLRHLVEGILKGDRAPEPLWNAAILENDWATDEPLQLLQFRQGLRYDKNSYSQYASTEIEGLWGGCISVEHRGTLLLLVNRKRFGSSDNENFDQALSYYLRDNLLYAGLSKLFTRADQVAQAYRQTEDALEIGSIKNPMNWYHRFDDYVIDYILSCCVEEYSAEHIGSSKLMSLRRHDEEKGTDYYRTLFTYFSCAFNAAKAAETLYIHRSTFINRMNKIREIAHIDYGSFDELTYLYLSFKLLENSETIQP